MTPIAIFELAVEIISEAPAIAKDIGAVVTAIKGFASAVETVTAEHKAAIKAAAVHAVSA